MSVKTDKNVWGYVIMARNKYASDSYSNESTSDKSKNYTSNKASNKTSDKYSDKTSDKTGSNTYYGASDTTDSSNGTNRR